MLPSRLCIGHKKSYCGNSSSSIKSIKHYTVDKYTTHYETSKIIVDVCTPQSGGRFVCSCYTIKAPQSIEPEYLIKTVTYAELKERIANKDGKVDISFFETEQHFISFDHYLSMLDRCQLANHCTDVINRRENRTHLFDNDLYRIYTAA